MKQAVMTSPGQIRVPRRAGAAAGPGQVLLRMKRIGVCGSDIHVYHGKHALTSVPGGAGARGVRSGGEGGRRRCRASRAGTR